jgi:threonine dehydrogenase-like Zn-dependent dehydrogenase
MKVVTWHGKTYVRVDTVPDPRLEEPTDALIEVTSINVCGSDLELYEMLGAFSDDGSNDSGARIAVTGGRPVL